MCYYFFNLEAPTSFKNKTHGNILTGNYYKGTMYIN